MRKQQKRIQIILVTIGLLLIAITYFYYPYLKKVDLIKGLPSQKDSKNVTDGDQQSTSFENVEYKGLYDLDKEFTVKSETAHILNTEPDIVYMKRMHVVLHLYYTTGSLQADMVDYDFETKYFKVSMFDDKAIKMKVIK